MRSSPEMGQPHRSWTPQRPASSTSAVQSRSAHTPPRPVREIGGYRDAFAVETNTAEKYMNPPPPVADRKPSRSRGSSGITPSPQALSSGRLQWASATVEMRPSTAARRNRSRQTDRAAANHEYIGSRKRRRRCHCPLRSLSRMAIKAVIFDLGRVIVPFDFTRGYLRLAPLCGLPAAENPRTHCPNRSRRAIPNRVGIKPRDFDA